MEKPIISGSFFFKKPSSEENNFLHIEKQRQDVYEASINLANYLKTEKIPNVVFLDNSARQAYVGLQEAWKKIAQDDKCPNIYFISPDDLRDCGDFEYYKEEFLKNYKKINPEDSILIYDACIHSGATIISVKEFFEYLGFKDVRMAVTSPNEEFPRESYKELDLICLDHRAARGCRPFGHSGYIEKDQGCIISKPSEKEGALETGRKEHQIIREAFNEQYEKNNS